MARPSILTDELRARIEREFATGATQGMVCQRTGVKARSLERWLAERKIVIRPPIDPESGSPSPDRLELDS